MVNPSGSEPIVCTADLPWAPSGTYTRADELVTGEIILILIDDLTWRFGIDDAKDQGDPDFDPQDISFSGIRFVGGPGGESHPATVRIKGNPLVGKVG